jgi:hypothetical protein
VERRTGTKIHADILDNKVWASNVRMEELPDSFGLNKCLGPDLLADNEKRKFE